MPARYVLFLSLTVAGSLRAQAAVAVPAGGLPPRNDSIYALRIDPSAYTGHDYVLLLEDGLVRLEADGRVSYTLRQVAQVLTQEGAEDWGELSLWHTPGRQAVRINWMRVVDPDGKVLSDQPAHQQEMSRPAEPESPVYSDRRALQATAAGIAPGTILDYSYTIEVVQPWVPGDFLYYWDVNGWTPVRRSRFTVDAPADMHVRVREKNLSFAAEDVVAGGRRVRRWAKAEIPAVVRETFAGTENDVLMWIAVSGPVSWRDIGGWYDHLMRDQYALTPPILAAHAAQLKGAATQDDSLRATYRWVAQDFRYVSLSLGDGGYQPRRPQDVFETRFGDCKDKTALFVSLARRMGLNAYPILVDSDGGVDSLLPSLKQFDHMIAAVARPRRTEYLDVTADLTPYGELPPGLQGEVGVALTARGAEVVVLPAAPPEHNRYHEEIVGAIGRDGRFVGRITVSAAGTEQYGLREKFADIHRQDAKTRDETLRRYALSVFSTAVVDSAWYVEGRDLTVPPSVTVWFTATNVVGTVGDKYYFNLPLSAYSDANVLSRVEAEGRRRFPIDVADVNSPSVYRSALEVQLPDGWRAEVPAAVSVDGAFGYYRAAYRQAGRTFSASREMGGRRGLEPPDSAGALRAWLKAVAGDVTKMIVLTRGTGLPRIAEASRDTLREGAGRPADVVLQLDDLPAGTKVVREGEAGGSDAFVLNLAATKPIASYQRNFAADRMVFTVGKSRLVTLQAIASAFHTKAEARRALEMLNLLDLRPLFSAVFGQLAGDQATLGESRSVAVSDVGDRSSGWVLQLVTPVATFDMAILVASRGRVATSILAVGPVGVRDEDLTGLLRTMDGRVRSQDAYQTDVPGGDTTEATVRAADSALVAHTTIALNDIALLRVDSAALTTRSASFERPDGWPTYSVDVQGRGFTFPIGSAGPISVSTIVTLHETEAQALKQVVGVENLDRKPLMRWLLRGMGEMAGEFAGDTATTIEATAAPVVGARSVARTARLRGMIRMDMDLVYFARGRLSAAVTVTWPPGRSDRAVAGAVAQEMLQRMRRVMPGAGDATPPPRVAEAVRRVVLAEHAVDSLVDARNFEAAFQVIERARLSSAPVGFASRTWNAVCWWASLNGSAKRAMAACEAAVAPDTSNIAYRDSRGLGRALSGDLAGAKDDFAYVVANAAEGPFLTKRAAWLEALKAGTNPFTPQVLDELKKQ